MTKYYLNTDGSNSNPKGRGAAGAAFVVRRGSKKRRILTKKYQLETGTNNYAELYAIFQALSYLKEILQEGDIAVIRSDSQWSVNMINRIYQPSLRGANTEFIHEIRTLKESLSFPIEIMWIPRKQNEAADVAAKEAMREARLRYE